ncbi:hypothetical protein BDR07DRAFT_1450592 [Suillus spraguei]|nr:hypothetical protein BDR07DRAFT_1450592 [Suillus spraguei]
MFTKDDIKVEHHPNSGINAKFEVAQIALEAALNNDQTDRLIKICRQCAIGNDKFTFENHKDIHRKWDAASQHVTGFTKEVILMTYEDKSWDFEVHYRDLLEWAADLLRDPHLFPHLTFNAQHLSKFDGENFVRFIDEPYTADAFWDLQSQLPEGAKPLTFILYADKTKLSTSGTAKAYPVVAWLANLPTDIRNGEGIGGGYVVGWLPVVKEDKEFVKKPGWVNFKNKVWHQAFSRILASLTSKSKTGQWFECLDRLLCWFFPSILILSADYEEQCVILWPCPICLVPRDALSDVSMRYPLQTSKDSQAIINLARTKHTLEETEKTLKEYGLRDVDNSLWLIQCTDVHRALSYDKLHFRDGGLFDDHLWVEFQKYLNDLGRDVVSHIDKRFKEFLCWRNQKHPNQVMDIAFTDSSIPENISKMILYAAHDVMTEEDCPLGYLLLRCICLYIEVDMYASLEVHTSDTICEGRNIVQMFSGFLKQYIDKSADIEDKGWNFPKLHMDAHLFDDIEAKGATRNYNTKPNEKMHGSLKDSYLLRTNFRNVAEQILCINHWQLVAEDIHRHLLDFDEYLRLQTQDQFDAADDALNATDDAVIPLAGFFHVKVGSKQPPLTFESVENIYHSDDAFSNLRIRLNDFLNDFLPAINIPLLQGKQICLRASDKITEFRFLKVNYESMVNWRQHTDYLCCSPQFFGAPHFDCIFIRMTPTKVIFGRLLFLFECTVGKHTFPLALVHPYDAPTGICLCKDKNFNLFRVRACTRAQSQFFSVRSIIRGVLLVPDGPSDYLVIDTVDTDMFVHMREMHLEAGHLCFFIKSHLIAPPSHSNISLPSTSSSNYTLQHSPSVHPSINQALVNIDVSTAVM